MSTEIKIWQIINDKLKPMNSKLADTGRKEHYDLEEWIAFHPFIVSDDIAIIGRQVQTRSGPLDLLAIDKSGNTIIIELKRDRLPREAIAQAIDYASDVAEWNVEKLNLICTEFTGKNLEDHFFESFPEVNLENLNFNELQKILLVGFGIDGALERMINWLSESYGVNINAVILKYIKTTNGDELLSRIAVISEELEQQRSQRSQRKKFQIQMSDEPGNYPEDVLAKKLKQYLKQNLWSARRLSVVILPTLLEREKVSREQLKSELVKKGEAQNLRDAGRFLSLISQQLGLAKNDFLRQVIGYEYPPDAPWMKENYYIRDGYKDLVREVLEQVKNE